MKTTIEQTQIADKLIERNSSPEKRHPLTLIEKRGDVGVTNESPITSNLKLPPWLNDDGSFKSDEEIQSLGKSWSAETWDSYLKVNVGDVEAEAQDLVFFPFVDTETVNFGTELLKTLRTQDDYENLPEAFDFALTFLSDREAQVIRLRYLKELSQEEISERLGVGINSIKSFRRKGLKKLRHLLPSEQFRTKYQEHIKHIKRKCHPNVTPESL